MKHSKKIVMIGTGLFMGVLFSLQAKSFSNVNETYERESKVNIFREIQIIKNSNGKLEQEIGELEDQLAKGNSKEIALENLSKEIEKMTMLSGDYDVQGPGVKIVIEKDLAALWFTDLTHELFSAGAEMVSINGFMLDNNHNGFDTIPNGKILLKDNILEAPYVFEAIGNSETLLQALNQNGGIIPRMKEALVNLKIEVSKADLIKIKTNKLSEAEK